MLTPPDGLAEAALVAALERWWGMVAASVGYRAVGWGSHHWEVADAAGSRWFVTVDELENKRVSRSEPLAAGYERLRASLATASALRDCGRAFVVAPVPASDGEPLARVGDGFAVAVYPFVRGHSYEWGEYSSLEHRLGVLDLLVAVHTAPPKASRPALADDFAVPHRDQLEAACDPASDAADCGPYSDATARLIQQNAAAIHRLLARYDDLVAQASSLPARAVLTHGEPHPKNTMRMTGGWVLIDWDTALVAPPERDLWIIDPGDGAILDRYAAATGVDPLPALLDLYRLRWDITDISLYVSRFCRPHAGSIDDQKTWEGLSSTVGRYVG